MKTHDEPTILVDMDGVLADYDGELYHRWHLLHPDKPLTPRETRTTHKVHDIHPEYEEELSRLTSSHDFFYELPLIDGAMEGMRLLQEEYHTIICTSPSLYNTACASGKLAWIKKHFGYEQMRQTIITKDKTTVIANYLIDDKPIVEGAYRPTWEHILFDQPYNQHVQKPRITWETLDALL